ncbi:hypothetical protein niasHT_004807 [Heterodera trifolii]|uniref:Uncharacterized protein n=1 Tax=Heterodera trifolii TaxID=157864 RepID=A0ABD2M9M4_9BILA
MCDKKRKAANGAQRQRPRKGGKGRTRNRFFPIPRGDRSSRRTPFYGRANSKFITFGTRRGGGVTRAKRQTNGRNAQRIKSEWADKLATKSEEHFACHRFCSAQTIPQQTVREITAVNWHHPIKIIP